MKMISRKALIVLLPALWLAGCGERATPGTEALEPEGHTIATAVFSNPSDFMRADELVVLDLDALGVTSDGDYRVESGGVELPSQATDADGDGEVEALAFVADFAPAESKTVEIFEGSAMSPEKRTQAEVSVKTGGSWEGDKYVGGTFVNVDSVRPPPQYTDHSEYIRYEGPGIESDKVGYRFYLDWRNGFDIFGKTATGLVLQDVGQDGYDSYHEPADWGLDILKVGEAVGVGGYGYWDGEKVIRVSETSARSATIVENGPLSSTLEILYENWQVPDLTTDLRALLSMKAGSHLVHTRLEAAPELEEIAVGIVKHADAEVIHGDVEMSGHAWTYVATWGPQALADGDLGMVVLFRKGERSEQTEDEHNLVSVLRTRNGRAEYYFGAVWSHEPDGITTREAFVSWLEQEAEKLTMPLRSRIRTAQTDAETSGDIDAQSALRWSVRLADSEIERLGFGLAYGNFDPDSNRDARWTYTTGLLAQAMDDLSAVTSEPRYAKWGKTVIDAYITEDGKIRTYDASLYNIDNVNSAKMLLRYLERTGDQKYRAAADAIRAQLSEHPRTSEGAFWHKQQYPWQLWLDGVYMGMPFLAHYSLIEDDAHGIEEAVAEFEVADRQLRDEASGLYFHAWDERAEQVWADPGTGLSSFFWSRGMGWFGMALVDILDFLPGDREDLREPIITILRNFADAILQHRVDGVWYQITDMPGATGNYPEASGSSMFVYMLAKAVNMGYLDDSYRDSVADSYASLVREFINVHESGAVSLKNVCKVAGLGFGRDGSYRYYMSEPVVSNDPKGVGPFIMAGIEVSKMLQD